MSEEKMVSVHEIRFQRNRRTGSWRGLCMNCGWSHFGTQEEVQKRAAVHDIEWVDDDPTAVAVAPDLAEPVEPPA